MVNFIIRPAEKRDIPSINMLTREMHKDLGKMVGLKFSNKDLEDESVRPSELKGIIVAEDKKTGKVLGYISFDQKPSEDEWYGKHIYLFEFAVTKEFRGKGIGETLIRKFIEKCKKKKLNIKVDTLVKNQRTVDFYRKLGFKPFMTYFVLDNNKKLKL